VNQTAEVRPTAPPAGRFQVLVFFACLFLLLSGGRLASGDAHQQLQATMLLVTTGRLGATAPPGGPESGWVQGRNGLYYEPHDVGEIALMLPAALAARLVSGLSGQPAGVLVGDPPVVARLGVALSCAILSAIGCLFAFSLFALYHHGRTAFLLAAALPVTTFLWPYTKTAWDVTGACCAMCALLYFSALLLRGSTAVRHAVLAGVALAAASSFRFSLLPFLLLSMGLVLYWIGPPRRRQVIACALALLAALLPELVYNFIRMGSPLRPGTTAATYLEGNNALTGNLVKGLAGLLAAPNKGLLVYSPIFLTLFLLPGVWRKATLGERRLLSAFAIGAAGYTLLIAKMKDWGAFGWGPRYLVPIVPVLFLGVSLVITRLWRRRRAPLAALLALSAALSLAPTLVNWNLATTEFPKARDQYAPLPYQQVAVWTGLVMGLQGKPLPIPPELAGDTIRTAGARFPDLWTVRLAERSPAGLAAGLAITLLLAGITARLLRRLARRESWPPA
jgi:hypothetical protein